MMSTTKTTRTSDRVVAILAATQADDVIAAARELGGDRVVEVTSGESLVALARDRRVLAACIASPCDLGDSSSAVLRVLAALHAAQVDLVMIGTVGAEDGTAIMRAAATLVERDRQRRIERLRRGRARARQRGVRQGRRRLAIDVSAALALIRQGGAIRAVAESLGVSPRTLRRRLAAEEGTPATHGSNPPSV
jgi:DNA invertase Pin-like site-specific DNA recombinase